MSGILQDIEEISPVSEWIPRYQRMVIAGKHVRLSCFEIPFYIGGSRRKRDRELGRASVASEEDKELNLKKNARRRENKVKDLVRCNVAAWKKSEETIKCNKFLTLTLSSTIEDISEGNKLLKGFKARLVRQIQKEYPDFQLKDIWVVEFQDENRGCVHWHLVCNLPFIPSKWVISRTSAEGAAPPEYLQLDGLFSAKMSKKVRTFENYGEAKRFRRGLSPEILSSGEIKCKRILYSLACAWGHGFVDIEVISSAKKAQAYISKLSYYLTKASADSRFVGKRAFDYSRNCDRPEVIVSLHRINKVIEEWELWLCLTAESYFECFLGFTEHYVFDLFLLDDVSFNRPPPGDIQLSLF